MKKKIMAVAAILAVLSICVTGSLAYLKATTGTIQNIFVFPDAKIDLTLTETGVESPTGSTTNEKKYETFLPGQDLEKDAKVTVEAGSEACYVFVQINELNNTRADEYGAGRIILWDIKNTWNSLEGHPGVYWQKVNDTTNAFSDLILENGKVTVNSAIEQTEWNSIQRGANKPSISFKVYAIQQVGMTSEENAWTLVSGV